mmetsp:Transcript_101675/g.265151  ORF Transcript_101675/g.265151 Transcript_101675/m.265151 type:complete len:365 (+) Transcript_101675:542-1636(+)
MRQGQRPDAQVRGRVRDGAENVLDRLDDLVDEHLAELELTVAVAVAVATTRRLLVQDLVAILGLFLAFLCFVLRQQDERLWQEHDGHGGHAELHEQLCYVCGALPQRHRVLLPHGHADEGVDDARRGVDEVRPFVEDHPIHPAEEADHEDHHGDALANEVSHAPPVESVAPPQQHADGHLHHPEQDGQLHLEGVHKHELVRRAFPRPIQAERVRAHRVFPGRVVVGLPVVALLAVGGAHPLGMKARLEQRQRHREEIVVHEASENSEEAHAQHHVPHHVQNRLGVLEGVCLHYQEDAEAQEQGAVADVAVHHPKDEREGDGGEDRWIRLLILGNTVGVDHLLPRRGEVVGADESGRHRARRALD